MTSWSRLDLGTGIVAVPGLDLMWGLIHDLVDVVEVEPQTMWTWDKGGGWTIDDDAFSWVERHAPATLCHGVGFPVGGTMAPDPAGVALAAASAERIGAAHWSEHLAFNQVTTAHGVIDAGFLLPPAQTWATVEAAVDHIRGYQRRSERPFLFETATNYLQPQPSELSDAAFITEVSERADCGILLDLHNLWANERNGRQSVQEVIDVLPLERVLEVHLAGGFETDGYYLDAHVGGIDPLLVEMAATILPTLPNVRAVVFEVVGEHLLQLGPLCTRSVLETIQRLVEAPPRRWDHRADRIVARPADRPAAEEWERRLLMATTRPSPTDEAEDPGVAILRMLTQSARLGRVTAGAPDVLSRLMADHGQTGTRALLQRFLQETTPKRWASEEAASFTRWYDGISAERSRSALRSLSL